MKITDHIARANKTLISFKVLPPLKGRSIQTLYEQLDPLIEFNPAFINVTYHRAQTRIKKMTDGSIRTIETRKRPGTVGICAAIMNHYKIDAVPHLICGGFTQRETEDALIDLNFLGIDNLLLLRGDGEMNTSEKGKANRYAIDLINQVSDLKKGIYVDEGVEHGNALDFCYGVAGYPEVHADASDSAFDLAKLKEKVEAGASFIITQMFFDNSVFFAFQQRCKEAGITIPIIPGLRPITKLRQMKVLPEIFKVKIPEALQKELTHCKSDEQIAEVGEEWLISQSEELKNKGVPIIHYFTTSTSSVIYRALKKIC